MIYTRDFNRKSYTPPPGYDGNAFNEQREMFSSAAKAEYVRRGPDGRVDYGSSGKNDSESHFDGEIYDEIQPDSPEEQIRDESHEAKLHSHEIEALSSLIESLHGRFGSEEMIILLVMLLVASDGIGPEVLILALILIAG